MKLLGFFLLLLFPLYAGAQNFESLVRELPNGGYSERGEVISQILKSGDKRIVITLQALSDGALYASEETGDIFIGEKDDLVDFFTQENLDVTSDSSIKKIKVNNKLRRLIQTGIIQAQHFSPLVSDRMQAAEHAFKDADPERIEILQEALVQEQDESVTAELKQAINATILKTDADIEMKKQAILELSALGAKARSPLSVIADVPELSEAYEEALLIIKNKERVQKFGQNMWYGLSLGSVLLLAAIGLAITFGVMGVINMAHGEMIMIGAYTTYVVQEIIRNNAPALFEYSLFIAIPCAFVIAGLVGVVIERFVVRYLYGRPLETLLATWGVSLILQQLTRSIFGPNNREVGNPAWMSGSVEFIGINFTWSRVWILIFATVIFLSLMWFLNKTLFGTQIRAVTQNRSMAANMGISTGKVDALAFGLGAGIAGLAGVALSQIDNVSPNLGQGYIVDSFMVVVFGGAGSLWGTVFGALTLGVATKLFEPVVGAVMAKIIILVGIILFIQRKPRGLFAIRGRAAE